MNDVSSMTSNNLDGKDRKEWSPPHLTVLNAGATAGGPTPNITVGENILYSS